MARDVSAETQTGRRCIASILITPPGGPPDQLGLGSLTLPGMEERYAFVWAVVLGWAAG